MLRMKKILASLVIFMSFLLIYQVNASTSVSAANNVRLQGYAASHPVNVYSSTSKDSKVLKSYNYGNQIYYYSYSDAWHQVTFYINGVSHRGYVHSRDVVDSRSKAPYVKGVALNKVNVRVSPKVSASILKSYKKGRVLTYRSYNDTWYEVTVIKNGKKQKGYIATKDIDTIVKNQYSTEGTTIKNQTNIYSLPSTDAKVLKKYNEGKVLKYKIYTENWYEATVYVGNSKKVGYIYAKDVESVKPYHSNPTISGIGINKTTRVYSSPSTSGKVVKSYKEGQLLKMKKYSTNWYVATIYVNGKSQKGYIYRNDIELIKNPQQTLRGVGISQPVPVYTLASHDSKVIKVYNYGNILKLRTFSKSWFEVTVKVNGKMVNGYISLDDVSTDLDSTIKGYASKNSTAVYSGTSRDSKVLKNYKKGQQLQYRPYQSSWFRATVKINGKSQTGYIHVSDVSPYPPKLSGYAKSNPTYVYSKTSRNSIKLKSYKSGQKIQFAYHNNSWYKATIYVKGKAKTGYISTADVVFTPVKKDQVVAIPILMYHQIGDKPRIDEYGRFVAANNFEKQMNYLKSSGYTPISFNEISKAKSIKKPILITFDDGYENNYIAYNILKKVNDKSFKAKATFFIIGSRIGVKNYLNEEQIKEMSDSGIIFMESHTMSHPFFNDDEQTSQLDYQYELLNSKKKIEEITGKQVVAFAYPYGSYNDFVINEVAKYYRYAVTTKQGIANINDSHYELMRVRVSFDTTLEQFKKSIVIRN